MSDETPVTPPAPPVSSTPPGGVDSTSKLLAVLGYIFWIVAVVALLIEPYKNQYFNKAHAVQAIVLGIIMWFIAWIPVIGWIIALIALVFAIIAILKALKGEVYQLPIVYGLAKSFIEE